MNKFLKEFKDRGYFYQCTNEKELIELLNKKKIKAYIGFDCTAQSLHVGSLLQIMCLRLLQHHGHQPIVLLGGGTTRIGDPSGKDKTRKILSENEIEKNAKNIEKILKNYLDTSDKKVKPKLNAYAEIAKAYSGEDGSGKISDTSVRDEVLTQTIQEKALSLTTLRVVEESKNTGAPGATTSICARKPSSGDFWCLRRQNHRSSFSDAVRITAELGVGGCFADR